jgi:hypothetical protein
MKTFLRLTDHGLANDRERLQALQNGCLHRPPAGDMQIWVFSRGRDPTASLERTSQTPGAVNHLTELDSWGPCVRLGVWRTGSCFNHPLRHVRHFWQLSYSSAAIQRAPPPQAIEQQHGREHEMIRGSVSASSQDTSGHSPGYWQRNRGPASVKAALCAPLRGQES